MSKELNEVYKTIYSIATNRLQEFENIWKTGNEEELFWELAFCILTPQSKARNAWSAINSIQKNRVLEKQDEKLLSESLNIVRFKNRKAKYLLEAYNKYIINKSNMREKLDSFKSTIEMREFIVEDTQGIGYKEGSHFLRNIGFGDDIAILDRHILKNLVIYDVIDEIPKSVAKNNYLKIENKMVDFSKKVDIPMKYLDLIFWYKEAGEVFK